MHTDVVTPTFTLASLCGDYGAVVTYRANVAAGFRILAPLVAKPGASPNELDIK